MIDNKVLLQRNEELTADLSELSVEEQRKRLQALINECKEFTTILCKEVKERLQSGELVFTDEAERDYFVGVCENNGVELPEAI